MTTVRVLGHGSAILSPALKTSFLLDQDLMFDVAPEAVSQLRRHGHDPKTVDTVFVSHLHADHYYGIVFLLMEYLVAGRNRPLRIMGPAGLDSALGQLIELGYPGVDAGRCLMVVGAQVIPVGPGSTFTTAGASCTVVKAEHGGIEGFGLRVESEHAALYFSGDTVMIPQVADAMEWASSGSFVDATSIHGEVPNHMGLMSDVVPLMESLSTPKPVYAIHRGFEHDQLPSRPDYVHLPVTGQVLHFPQV